MHLTPYCPCLCPCIYYLYTDHSLYQCPLQCHLVTHIAGGTPRLRPQYHGHNRIPRSSPSPKYTVCPDQRPDHGQNYAGYCQHLYLAPPKQVQCQDKFLIATTLNIRTSLNFATVCKLFSKSIVLDSCSLPH